jgi:hypothetical protein
VQATTANPNPTQNPDSGKSGAWQGSFAAAVLLMAVVASVFSKRQIGDVEITEHAAPKARVRLSKEGVGKIEALAGVIRLRAQSNVAGTPSGPQITIKETRLLISHKAEDFDTGIDVGVNGRIDVKAKRMVVVDAKDSIVMKAPNKINLG